MTTKEEIELVVKETISKVETRDKLVFSRPTTMRGWVYVVATIGGIVSFLASSIIHINKVVEHHNLPYHPGTAELVAKVQEAIDAHINDEAHHIRRTDVKLQILEETRPMKDDIQNIKEDIGVIKTNINLLLDRHQRLEHRDRD